MPAAAGGEVEHERATRELRRLVHDERARRAGRFAGLLLMTLVPVLAPFHARSAA
jgi:hypothetical protein